jgi:cytochrome c oxidase assembly protein subunit 15
VATTILIYVQILLGALMRHSYAIDGRPAGFAIPDYPLAFGQLMPLAQLGSWATAIDFLHRLTAVAAVVAVGVLAVRVFRRHFAEDALVRPAALLALVLLAQIALGGLTVLSGGHPAVSTTHAGAVTAALGAALVLAIRSFRSGTALAGPATASAGDRKGAAE